MLYLTCTTITSLDLAHYEVSRAKDWVSVDCGTRWFGHVSRSSSLAKTIIQGIVKGKRKRGRQKKRWINNIKEWTGMDFASSNRAAENRTRWKGIVANSSVVQGYGIE